METNYEIILGTEKFNELKKAFDFMQIFTDIDKKFIEWMKDADTDSYNKVKNNIQEQLRIQAAMMEDDD